MLLVARPSLQDILPTSPTAGAWAEGRAPTHLGKKA